MKQRGESDSSEAVGPATGEPTAALPHAPPWDNGTPALPASLWPSIFHRASAAEQAELLESARTAGVLHASGLPPRLLDDAARHPLEWLLSGKLDALPPVVAEPPANWHDDCLTDEQRSVVARLLACPDVGLVRGHAGTGKNRVLSELIRQLVSRGERVLILGPTRHDVDRLLLRLSGLHLVCCLAEPAEEDSLPVELRESTLAAHRRALQGEALARAIQERDAAAAALRGLEHDLEGLEQLRRLHASWQDASARHGQCRLERERLPEVVREEGSRDVTPATEEHALPRVLERERQRHETRVKELNQLLSEAKADCLAHEQALAKKLEQVEAQNRVVEAKREGRYWSWTWWRGLLQGRAPERLAEFQTLAAEAKTRLLDAKRHDLELRLQLEQETERHAIAVEQILAGELATRQAELDARLLAVERDMEAVREAWRTAAGSVGAITVPAHPECTPDWDALRRELEAAKRAAQAEWQLRGQWLEALQALVRDLDANLLSSASVVAGTHEALCNSGLEKLRARPRSRDWLIVVGAERMPDAHLFAWATFASRCILSGEPAANAGAAPANSWPRLWRLLHDWPPAWPHQWCEDKAALVCRRVSLSEADRARLEVERLVDQPDVELRIFSSGDQRPVLAEIAFPKERFTVLAAKAYVYQQLGELTLQAEASDACWQRRTDQLWFVLQETDGGQETSLTLEPGVREVVRGNTSPREVNGLAGRRWQSLRLEFDLAAGWDRERAERWLFEHVGRVERGRTAELRFPWKASPGLVHLWNDVLQLDLTTDAESAGDAVRFVDLSGDGRRPARNDMRGRSANTPPRGNQVGHQGAEIDLAEPRQRQRLPFDLQMQLPARGIVNLEEAERLIAELERHLAATRGPAPTSASMELSSCAVLTWQAPQLALLQALWNKSKNGHGQRVCFRSTAEAEPFLADVVFLSLTRSHEQAPIRYADQPLEWRVALMAARRHLILIGDLATLARVGRDPGRSGPASWERLLVSRLLRHLEPGNGVPRPVLVRQGVPA